LRLHTTTVTESLSMPLGVRYEPAFVAGFADVLGWPRDCAEPPLHSSGKYPAEDKGCVRAL